MSQMRVGLWGKNLAIRFPSEVVRTLKISDGEKLDVQERDGEIVIRRDDADSRAAAMAAAEEMRAESERYTLGVSAKTLIEEGRR